MKFDITKHCVHELNQKIVQEYEKTETKAKIIFGAIYLFSLILLIYLLINR